MDDGLRVPPLFKFQAFPFDGSSFDEFINIDRQVCVSHCSRSTMLDVSELFFTSIVMNLPTTDSAVLLQNGNHPVKEIS
jgi:hypothetical protein